MKIFSQFLICFSFLFSMFLQPAQVKFMPTDLQRNQEKTFKLLDIMKVIIDPGANRQHNQFIAVSIESDAIERIFEMMEVLKGATNLRQKKVIKHERIERLFDVLKQAKQAIRFPDIKLIERQCVICLTSGEELLQEQKKLMQEGRRVEAAAKEILIPICCGGKQILCKGCVDQLQVYAKEKHENITVRINAQGFPVTNELGMIVYDYHAFCPYCRKVLQTRPINLPASMLSN